MIEDTLKRNIRGNRAGQQDEATFRSVDYVEVVYQDGHALKRTIIFRDAAGNVQGPFTDIIKSTP